MATQIDISAFQWFIIHIHTLYILLKLWMFENAGCYFFGARASHHLPKYGSSSHSAIVSNSNLCTTIFKYLYLEELENTNIWRFDFVNPICWFLCLKLLPPSLCKYHHCHQILEQYVVGAQLLEFSCEQTRETRFLDGPKVADFFR